MAYFTISNKSSSQFLGIFEADTHEQALDALALETGSTSYAEMCAALDQDVEVAASDLVVTELAVERLAVSSHDDIVRELRERLGNEATDDDAEAVLELLRNECLAFNGEVYLPTDESEWLSLVDAALSF